MKAKNLEFLKQSPCASKKIKTSQDSLVYLMFSEQQLQQLNLNKKINKKAAEKVTGCMETKQGEFSSEVMPVVESGGNSQFVLATRAMTRLH